MSLDGAQMSCVNAAGGSTVAYTAKGNKFTVGSYLGCDLVLPDAERIHCEIQCDSFGRVTIYNHSRNKPILLNDQIVHATAKRPLPHGARIQILNDVYSWQFARTTDELLTPDRPPAEQASNSAPSLIAHRQRRQFENRLTVHNFRYSINSDDEGNTSIELRQLEITSNSNAAEEPECNELEESMPKVDLLEATQNKENTSTLINKTVLQLCARSDVVITSFSPRQTGVKIEKSFTRVVKPSTGLGLLSVATTPRSVYNTPKSVLSEQNDDSCSRDLMEYSTPSTSKIAVAGMRSSSMYLVDLTTPQRLRPTLKQTPASSDVISVDSTDESSDASPLIIDITNSASPSTSMMARQKSRPLAKTPKDQLMSAGGTPKHTSLVKRAVLSSAKKQCLSVPRRLPLHHPQPQWRTPVRRNLSALADEAPMTSPRERQTSSIGKPRHTITSQRRNTLAAAVKLSGVGRSNKLVAKACRALNSPKQGQSPHRLKPTASFAPNEASTPSREQNTSAELSRTFTIDGDGDEVPHSPTAAALEAVASLITDGETGQPFPDRSVSKKLYESLTSEEMQSSSRRTYLVCVENAEIFTENGKHIDQIVNPNDAAVKDTLNRTFEANGCLERAADTSITSNQSPKAEIAIKSIGNDAHVEEKVSSNGNSTEEELTTEAVDVIEDSICEEVVTTTTTTNQDVGITHVRLVEDTICEEVATSEEHFPTANASTDSQEKEEEKVEEDEANLIVVAPPGQTPTPTRSLRRFSMDQQKTVSLTPRRSARLQSMELGKQPTRRASCSAALESLAESSVLATPKRKRRLTENMSTPTRKSLRLPSHTRKRSAQLDESVGDMGVVVEEMAAEQAEADKLPADEDYGTEVPASEADAPYKIDYHGMRELLKTPKSCSTPRFRGLRELMRTPKVTASPMLDNIEELLEGNSNDASATPKRQITANRLTFDLTQSEPAGDAQDMYFKTPRAKNLMIPIEPASAVLQTRDNSQDTTTEYDLNATNATLHLDKIFDDVLTAEATNATITVEDSEAEINVTTVSTGNVSAADPLATSAAATMVSHNNTSSEAMMTIGDIDESHKDPLTSTAFKPGARDDLKLSALNDERYANKSKSLDVCEVSGIQLLDQTSDSMFSEQLIVTGVDSCDVTLEETRPIASRTPKKDSLEESSTDSTVGLAEPLVLSDDQDVVETPIEQKNNDGHESEASIEELAVQIETPNKTQSEVDLNASSIIGAPKSPIYPIDTSQASRSESEETTTNPVDESLIIMQEDSTLELDASNAADESSSQHLSKVPDEAANDESLIMLDSSNAAEADLDPEAESVEKQSSAEDANEALILDQLDKELDTITATAEESPIGINAIEEALKASIEKELEHDEVKDAKEAETPLPKDSTEELEAETEIETKPNQQKASIEESAAPLEIVDSKEAKLNSSSSIDLVKESTTKSTGNLANVSVGTNLDTSVVTAANTVKENLVKLIIPDIIITSPEITSMDIQDQNECQVETSPLSDSSIEGYASTVDESKQIEVTSTQAKNAAADNSKLQQEVQEALSTSTKELSTNKEPSKLNESDNVDNEQQIASLEIETTKDEEELNDTTEEDTPQADLETSATSQEESLVVELDDEIENKSVAIEKSVDIPSRSSEESTADTNEVEAVAETINLDDSMIELNASVALKSDKEEQEVNEVVSEVLSASVEKPVTEDDETDVTAEEDQNESLIELDTADPAETNNGQASIDEKDFKTESKSAKTTSIAIDEDPNMTQIDDEVRNEFDIQLDSSLATADVEKDAEIVSISSSKSSMEAMDTNKTDPLESSNTDESIIELAADDSLLAEFDETEIDESAEMSRNKDETAPNDPNYDVQVVEVCAVEESSICIIDSKIAQNVVPSNTDESLIALDAEDKAEIQTAKKATSEELSDEESAPEVKKDTVQDEGVAAVVESSVEAMDTTTAANVDPSNTDESLIELDADDSAIAEIQESTEKSMEEKQSNEVTKDDAQNEKVSAESSISVKDTHRIENLEPSNTDKSLIELASDNKADIKESADLTINKEQSKDKIASEVKKDVVKKGEVSIEVMDTNKSENLETSNANESLIKLAEIQESAEKPLEEEKSNQVTKDDVPNEKVSAESSVGVMDANKTENVKSSNTDESLMELAAGDNSKIQESAERSINKEQSNDETVLEVEVQIEEVSAVAQSCFGVMDTDKAANVEPLKTDESLMELAADDSVKAEFAKAEIHETAARSISEEKLNQIANHDQNEIVSTVEESPVETDEDQVMAALDTSIGIQSVSKETDEGSTSAAKSVNKNQVHVEKSCDNVVDLDASSNAATNLEKEVKPSPTEEIIAEVAVSVSNLIDLPSTETKSNQNGASTAEATPIKDMSVAIKDRNQVNDETKPSIMDQSELKVSVEAKEEPTTNEKSSGVPAIQMEQIDDVIDLDTSSEDDLELEAANRIKQSSSMVPQQQEKDMSTIAKEPIVVVPELNAFSANDTIAADEIETKQCKEAEVENLSKQCEKNKPSTAAEGQDQIHEDEIPTDASVEATSSQVIESKEPVPEPKLAADKQKAAALLPEEPIIKKRRGRKPSVDIKGFESQKENKVEDVIDNDLEQIDMSKETSEQPKPTRRGRKPMPEADKAEAHAQKQPEKELGEEITEEAHVDQPRRRGRPRKPSAEVVEVEVDTQQTPQTKRRLRKASAEVRETPERIQPTRHARKASAETVEVAASIDEHLEVIEEAIEPTQKKQRLENRTDANAEHKQQKRRGRTPSVAVEVHQESLEPVKPSGSREKSVPRRGIAIKAINEASAQIVEPADIKPKRRGRKPTAQVEHADDDPLESIEISTSTSGKAINEATEPLVEAADIKPKRRGRKPTAQVEHADDDPLDSIAKSISTPEKAINEASDLVVEPAEIKAKRRGRKPTQETHTDEPLLESIEKSISTPENAIIEATEQLVEAAEIKPKRRGRKASAQETHADAQPLESIGKSTSTPEEPSAEKHITQRGRKPSAYVEAPVEEPPQAEKKLTRRGRKPSPYVEELAGEPPQAKKVNARRGGRTSLSAPRDELEVPVPVATVMTASDTASPKPQQLPSSEDELTPRRREGRNLPRKNYDETHYDDKLSAPSRRGRKPAVTKAPIASPTIKVVETEAAPLPTASVPTTKQQKAGVEPAMLESVESKTAAGEVTLSEPTSAQRREGRNMPRKNYSETSDDDKPGTSRARRIRQPVAKALESLVNAEERPATPKRRKAKVDDEEPLEKKFAAEESTPQSVAKSRVGTRRKVALVDEITEVETATPAATKRGPRSRKENATSQHDESALDVDVVPPKQQPVKRNARKAKAVEEQTEDDVQPTNKRGRGAARAKTPVAEPTKAIDVDVVVVEPTTLEEVPATTKRVPAARGRARAIKVVEEAEAVQKTATTLRSARGRKVHFEATVAAEAAPQRATRSRRK
ncbi:titin isoform X2 [Drosophila grimshawi]|uniref:titin isoform X2 n=1 Tax=Drosophila grimshawi TaxID=7222 RepID=UPI000C86EC71|nr:titin isoform X2 [Drosophila grimshawi]